ncbi:ribosome biogenesis protein ytm1 [Vanrija albida]|uniref:Ribosome biogenesis protein ytm1 n=1 Tax=Vanrija albida TaxID=181172 RepID=A0ABR3QG27_9TREE
MSGSNGAPARQIPVNLFTRSAAYAIPQSTYFIPADWRRFQLSELINKVLGHGAESGLAPVPFDFVVDGEVLRGSLDAWVKKHRGDDEETAINVEYLQSVLPPSEVGRWEQDDWVSGLSLARPGHLLVASYLSNVQVTSLSSSAPLYTLPLPTSLGATSATWVSPSSSTADILVAAGGVDRATHVFSLPSLEPDVAASEGATAREVYTLMGHTGPISSVAASGRDVLSASWDGLLHLYALPEDEPTEHQVPAEPTSYLPGQKKRRKLEGDAQRIIEGLTDGDVGEGGWRRVPDVVFRGHHGRVGAGIFDREDPARVWSAGWDGSVRGWDAETGAGVVVRQGPADKALLCLDQFAQTATLAAGSMDRTVTLWDTRQATSLIAATFNLASPVPSIACHPISPFTFAAATYSGNVQIWDVRSPKHALFSVKRTPKDGERTETKNGKSLGERLLAVAWDGEVLAAGGEDGEVGTWRARGE